MSTEESNKQKIAWEQVGKFFNSYEEAATKKEELKKTHKHIKIRRCGSYGTKFKVKVGEPIKKKEDKKAKKKSKK